MGSRMERDRRWALIGDDAGVLTPGAPAPRWAGVLAVVGVLGVAVTAGALGASAPAALPLPQVLVSPAASVDVATTITEEPMALQDSTSSYAPGQHTLWHRHPGLDSVTVGSGPSPGAIVGDGRNP